MLHFFPVFILVCDLHGRLGFMMLFRGIASLRPRLRCLRLLQTRCTQTRRTISSQDTALHAPPLYHCKRFFSLAVNSFSFFFFVYINGQQQPRARPTRRTCPVVGEVSITA